MIAQMAFPAPANTSHAAGDSVGGLGTFNFLGSGVVGVEYVLIRNATLLHHAGTVFTTTWSLHLYKGDVAPATFLDDAAWDLTTDAERAKYLGKIDFAQLVDIGTSLLIETTGINKPIPVHGGKVYGYLVNNTTVTTPAAVNTVTLYASKDAW